MSNLPPGTVPIEYTRATGAFFPPYATAATETSQATTATTVAESFPASPSQGQQVYRSDLGHLYLWTGSQWVLIS